MKTKTETRRYRGIFYQENSCVQHQRSCDARNASDAFHRILRQLQEEHPQATFDVDTAHVWRLR